MKTYPSIPFMNGLTKGQGIPEGDEWFVFDKLDGSNIRAEWNPKRGFYKYGRRKALLDDSNPWLLESPDVLKDQLTPKLDAEFRKRKWKRVLCFFEFHGPTSFAGHHEKEDHRMTLIDINVHPKGFLCPKDFVAFCQDAGLLEGTDWPRLLHQGPIDDELLTAIRLSTLPDLTMEGAVAKWQDKKGNRKTFKVKTKLWLDALRTYCGDDDVRFKKLM